MADHRRVTAEEIGTVVNPGETVSLDIDLWHRETAGWDDRLTQRAARILHIFNTYGTDKGYAHHYEGVYAQVPETIAQVLEIGVQHGASVDAWLDLFPEADIIGIDVTVTLAERFRGNPRVTLISVPFNEVEMTVFGDTRFDLIVDDGSHIPDEQVAAVRKFYPFLVSGGMFVVEDVQEDVTAKELLKVSSELGGTATQVRTGASSDDHVVVVKKR